MRRRRGRRGRRRVVPPRRPSGAGRPSRGETAARSATEVRVRATRPGFRSVTGTDRKRRGRRAGRTGLGMGRTHLAAATAATAVLEDDPPSRRRRDGRAILPSPRVGPLPTCQLRVRERQCCPPHRVFQLSFGALDGDFFSREGLQACCVMKSNHSPVAFQHLFLPCLSGIDERHQWDHASLRIGWSLAFRDSLAFCCHLRPRYCHIRDQWGRFPLPTPPPLNFSRGRLASPPVRRKQLLSCPRCLARPGFAAAAARRVDRPCRQKK